MYRVNPRIWPLCRPSRMREPRAFLADLAHHSHWQRRWHSCERCTVGIAYHAYHLVWRPCGPRRTLPACLRHPFWVKRRHERPRNLPERPPRHSLHGRRGCRNLVLPGPLQSVERNRQVAEAQGPLRHQHRQPRARACPTAACSRPASSRRRPTRNPSRASRPNGASWKRRGPQKPSTRSPVPNRSSATAASTDWCW